MRNTHIAMTAALAGALVAASGALAHHSYAMFDRTQSKTVMGTVRQLEWTMPHVHLWMYVDNGNGGQDIYAFEFGGDGVNGLNRHGWNKRMLSPGDKVTVKFNPLRDGRTGGLFQNVTLANGEVWDQNGLVPAGGRQGPPGP